MASFFDSRNRKVKITAFYALSLPEFNMKPHSHDSCEIMYVTSGSCLVEFSDREARLLAGQFVFLDAGVTHRLRITKDSPCSILNLEFCCGKEGEISVEEVFKNSRTLREFSKKKEAGFVADDLRSMGYSLKDLIAFLQKETGEEDYLFTVLFYRVLLELASSRKEKKKSAGISYLKKACGYIEENLHSSLKVSEIAAYAEVNKSYLQLLFSKFLGYTITDYINRKRIEEAVFLLINSSMNVTDIAFFTGYNSRQHFAHVFEKYHGMGPMKYRKLHSKTLNPDTKGKQYILGQSKRELVELKR